MMNTSTFKEVFTASIKVFPYCDIILFNSFVDCFIVLCKIWMNQFVIIVSVSGGEDSHQLCAAGEHLTCPLSKQ